MTENGYASPFQLAGFKGYEAFRLPDLAAAQLPNGKDVATTVMSNCPVKMVGSLAAYQGATLFHLFRPYPEIGTAAPLHSFRGLPSRSAR